MPLSLSDDEMAAVTQAAAPIDPRLRDAFLIDVANQLSKHPQLGPGIVSRIVAQIQHQYLAPRSGHHGKYGQ